MSKYLWIFTYVSKNNQKWVNTHKYLWNSWVFINKYLWINNIYEPIVLNIYSWIFTDKYLSGQSAGNSG
jgi:hypothetical protein